MTPTYSEYKGSSPSLKNITQKKVEEAQPEFNEQKQDTENRPKEIFSNDELKTAWLRYAEKIKSKMPRMYQVLTNHIPIKINDAQIQVQLASESQKKILIEKIQADLLGFLKEELSNFDIELKSEVVEELKKKNLIYTANDKFKYLAEQNPKLESLKKIFNLDFE